MRRISLDSHKASGANILTVALPLAVLALAVGWAVAESNQKSATLDAECERTGLYDQDRRPIYRCHGPGELPSWEGEDER